MGEKTEVGEIIHEKEAFNSPFFPILGRIIQVSDGTIRNPQFVWDRSNKFFVVAVARTANENFVLVSEPKYGQMRRLIACPGGDVKKGEKPIEAARREFREETGYDTRDWTLLRRTLLVDCPDKIDGGGHYLFLGENAVKVGEPEPGREVVLVSQDELEGMLDDKSALKLEISVSVAALAIALRFLAKSRP